jgi:hypothetical protein
MLRISITASGGCPQKAVIIDVFSFQPATVNMEVMIVCAAGDIHGAIHRFYHEVLAFEESLGVRFAWVLRVDDFGIWPDPTRIDGETKRHDGAGDFPVWWSERREAPRKTLFIKGNHEDFVWLNEQADPEVLAGIFYLRNGTRFDVDDGDETLSVGGLGGCFGPSDYERRCRNPH